MPIHFRLSGARASGFGASMIALAAADPSLGADLALKRVVLGTGGVGYFEYAAEVEAGETTLQLRARLDQVDDILKSLIVTDAAGAATATLPGKAGAAEAFASLPFTEADLKSLPALLAALKGASVRVDAPRKLAGSIVSAATETIKDKDGSQRAVTRVSLLSGLTVEQFVLEESEGLTFDDSRIGAQVDEALKALRAARDRSGRDITIHLAAGEKRAVRLGYVAEAPVWKAAYRLSLPEKGGKARLQGWAVLENMTGAEWNDVALTLSSGSPVTFRQALYDPYYVQRQLVAPPVNRLALPKTDQGQIFDVAGNAGTLDANGRRVDVPERIRSADQVAPADEKVRQAAPAAPEANPAPPPLGAVAESADGEENLSGASFALTLPVKAKAGESMTLPFIDTEIAADETAWMQPRSAGVHPWHAVRLANSGEVALPAGSVTLYETKPAGPLFAGEAQLGNFPAAQKRLIAFGADQKMRVAREAKSKGLIAEIVLAKGTMTIRRQVRETTLYRLANDDSAPRTIIVDHPRADGLTLAAPALAGASLVEGAWRLSREVAPGKTEILEVAVDQPVEQTIAIGDLARGALAQALGIDDSDATRDRSAFLLLLTQIGVTGPMQERLQKLADAADSLHDAGQRIEKLAGEREAIVGDQDRLRENLKAAPAGGDLAKAESKKLLGQEAQLDALDGQIKGASAAKDAAQAALEDLAGRSAGGELRFEGKAKF